MSIISVEHLKFSYSQKVVIDDVSFAIAKGSYTSIVGKNGSGKSTLARLICGLEEPSFGKVEIQPENKIGIVFQSPKDQIVSGIVSRDTAFGPQNLGLNPGEIELRTIESLNVVDMLDRAGDPTAALSLGQTQKIALSGILALRPEILILDEAVSMIDSKSRSDLLDFIDYWHKCGNTIVQITHDMEVIERSDNIIEIENGKVSFYGTKNAYLADKNNVLKISGSPLPVADKKLLAEKIKNSSAEMTFCVKNLNYVYGSKKINGHGIFDISFNLYKGTLTALTGQSGAGKSTILELCTGLLNAESGKLYGARPVLAQQNAKAALFETFAADDVAFGPRNLGITGKNLKGRVQKAMDDAALPYQQFGEKRTFELSGGEQRRLSIAGILALDSDIIFFDEPTAGLDCAARSQVLYMMKKLAEEGKTVLFSTHHFDEAQFADREIYIENGKLVKDTVGDDTVSDIPESLSELSASESAKLLENLQSVSYSLSCSKEKKKSPVERLSAWFRIILFSLLFVSSLAARPVWLCAIMLLISVIYDVLCGFRLKKLLISSLKILPFLLFFSIFQMIFYPALEGEIHFTNWKWFTVTPSKIFFCLAAIIRTDAALACISGLFVSTPEYDLIDGLNGILLPLQLIHIPVRHFILIVEIIFRFIPLLVDEASSIIKTQIIRGGLGKVHGRMARIRAAIPLIVPLIIQTIKRSESLADAITVRCFK